MSDSSNTTNKKFLYFQQFYSCLLLIFCITLVMGSIFTRQTRLAAEVNPGVALVVLLLGIAWLTMVEGGQGAIVGLASVNPDLYKESHPKTFKTTTVAHKGDNLDRYLLGRQFMVILIVFAINLAGETTANAEMWGLPQWVTAIFLSGAVAMILFTNMVGQNSAVNSCHCMLDYLNNYFAIFTFWVAMGIEFSGVLHTAYIIQRTVGWLAKQPVESNEPPRSLPSKIFFWGRCLMSVGILGISFAVTIQAIFAGNTKMWDSVPPAASLVLFFGLLVIVGTLEAMQIAYFAVSKLAKSQREQSFFSKKTCQLLFENNARGLAAFMIGRQLAVVACMFFVARVSSVNMSEDDENIFGVSDGIQKLFNTGLLGAVIVALLGSIPWRLIASAFPMFFVNNPIVYIFLRICLFLEMTGICSGAWVLAALHAKLEGFQRDEVYIGTAEERAAKGMEDHDDIRSVGSHAPHMYENGPLPQTLEDLEAAEAQLRNELEKVQEHMKYVSANKEKLMNPSHDLALKENTAKMGESDEEST
ncbi:silicon transporter [Nitzschia inconspicua]|uniref:Silicon transporter n=1 Tax=Nitzschia inconspicua TaxID=303405 RepID=A0A9K3PLP4_9STRA|nr:silicon transporter [Nitzschia inconspicua]